MLIASHGGLIRVFPAVPAAWSNAVFRDLSAEGGFLVSAERKAGKTRWVRVRSLAGEPCRVQVDGKVTERRLAIGEEWVLGDGQAVVAPLSPEPATANPWGVKVTGREPRRPCRGAARPRVQRLGPGLEPGRPAMATKRPGGARRRTRAAAGSRSIWAMPAD